ncbi:MAG TPA: class I SAM-dependent methyltransferase [Opitutaceae bacterium]|jgi:demethylmenaquinone methyltransferase/2-methoxy-6-polyprenyl-1,4-benzoquinol methylase|nr:class I SAM-dependent methyltransferase [Opitutaceae bacterium]
MNNDLVGYYSQRANEYERIYARPERQEDLGRLRDRLGSFFEGDHVLEVACGTGYWTEVVARSAHSIFATDITEKVLAIAKTKDFRGAAVEFHQADAYALPKFDGLFNAGFGAFWWSHIPKARIQEFLTSFHSHLAPGAKVAFIDNRYIEGNSTPIFRAGEEADTYQMRTLQDGKLHKVLKNFPSPEELKTTIGDMGIHVEVTLFDYYWLLSYQTN